MIKFKNGDVVRIKKTNKKLFGIPIILFGEIIHYSVGMGNAIIKFPNFGMIRNINFMLPITEIVHASEEEKEQFYALKTASNL